MFMLQNVSSATNKGKFRSGTDCFSTKIFEESSVCLCVSVYGRKIEGLLVHCPGAHRLLDRTNRSALSAICRQRCGE